MLTRLSVDELPDTLLVLRLLVNGNHATSPVSQPEQSVAVELELELEDEEEDDEDDEDGDEDDGEEVVNALVGLVWYSPVDEEEEEEDDEENGSVPETDEEKEAW